MIVLQIIIGVVAAVGVGFLLADFMKIPSLKASKAANSVGRKGKKKTGIIELYRRDFAKIVLNLEPDEAKYVQDVLKLTKTEIDSITRFERGEALICSGANKVPVSIKASPAEHELITTDRSEPESLMRKRHSIASE